MDEDFILVRGVFTACGMPSMKIKQLETEFFAMEGDTLPWKRNGFANVQDFLEAAGMRVNGDSVSFRSKNAAHISDMIGKQKQAPKLAKAPSARKLNEANNNSISRAPVTRRPAVMQGNTEISEEFKEELRAYFRSQPEKVEPVTSFIMKFDSKSPHKISKFIMDNRCGEMEFFARIPDICTARDRGGSLYVTSALPRVAAQTAPSPQAPQPRAPVSSRATASSTPSVDESVSSRRSSVASSSNAYQYLSTVPFSTAFKSKRVKVGSTIRVTFGDFLSGKNLEAACVLQQDAAAAQSLSLKSGQCAAGRIPSDSFYKGMPCRASMDGKLARGVLSQGSSVVNGEVTVFLVDHGVSIFADAGSIYEMDDFESETLAFGVIIKNIAPPRGKTMITLLAKQQIKGLLKGVTATVSVTGIDAESGRANVDLVDTDKLESLISENRIKISSGSPQVVESTAFEIAKVAILPNACPYFVLRRNKEYFVPSGCLSSLLGMNDDSFVARLREHQISVETQPCDRALLQTLIDKDCPFIDCGKMTLIPLPAALPLAMSFGGFSEEEQRAKIHKPVYESLLEMAKSFR